MLRGSKWWIAIPWTIALDEPLAPSLVILGLAYADIVPQDEVEKQGNHFGRAPVGTGPFKFVRWTPHQEIVLEAALTSITKGARFLTWSCSGFLAVPSWRRRLLYSSRDI